MFFLGPLVTGGYRAEMLASRPGLGLKAIQDHFLEVLVLVLVLRYLVLVLTLVVLVLGDMVLITSLIQRGSGAMPLETLVQTKCDNKFHCCTVRFVQPF